jgi:hypothetical protein
MRECQIDDVEMDCEFIWLSTVSVMGCSEYNSGPSGLVKGAEFLDHLSNY